MIEKTRVFINNITNNYFLIYTYFIIVQLLPHYHWSKINHTFTLITDLSKKWGMSVWLPRASNYGLHNKHSFPLNNSKKYFTTLNSHGGTSVGRLFIGNMIMWLCISERLCMVQEVEVVACNWIILEDGKQIGVSGVSSRWCMHTCARVHPTHRYT